MCQKKFKNICPAFILFWVEVLPFLAGVNYTSQLLQLMHLVESDPKKGTKYFSCQSTISFSLELTSQLSNFRRVYLPEDYCFTFAALPSSLPMNCEFCLSQSHHPSDVVPDVLQWNSVIFYVRSSDLCFLPFTQRKVLNICSGPSNVHENQKQTLVD